MSDLKTVKYLVIHCSATKPSMDVGLKEIRGWHKAKGWSDIGYHFVVRRSGEVETGRPVTQAGAHVQGYNSVSLGVCMVGGLNEKTGKAENNFTKTQFSSLHELMQYLHGKFPGATILGHRDLSPDKDKDGVVERNEWLKDCPCFDARKWWGEEGSKKIT